MRARARTRLGAGSRLGLGARRLLGLERGGAVGLQHLANRGTGVVALLGGTAGLARANATVLVLEQVFLGETTRGVTSVAMEHTGS